MYRKSNQPELTPEKFELPVVVQLSSDNRWVIMANLIPWSEFESEYAEKFSEKMGAPAKPFRMALGGNCSITAGGERRKRRMGLLKNCPSALIAE